jgi:hypothetical protein
MAKEFTLTVSEEERNTLLDCVRLCSRIADDKVRAYDFPEAKKVYEDKYKSIHKVWEKVEQTKPTEK